MLALRLRVATVCFMLGILGTVAYTQELPGGEAWAALERGDASKAAAIFRLTLVRITTSS